jgi:hypothetical protein
VELAFVPNEDGIQRIWNIRHTPVLKMDKGDV